MNIKYVNSNGEIINFTKWPLMLSDPEQLIGSEWLYSTSGSNKINNFEKAVTSKEVTVQIFADSEGEYKRLLNDLVRITENDLKKETPGQLEINGYYLECYITAGNYGEFEEDFYAAEKKIRVTAEKWIWFKTTRYEFIPENTLDTDGRGYPYGYDYDYSMGSGYSNYLNNEHFAPCDFIMKIKGYVIKPSITIGSHIYRVNETVQANEVLTIDSKKKSIILTKNNGIEVNIFSKRHKKSYIFEKIQSGKNKVFWNSGFNFEISLYEERSEPKWI